ncbi:MAG: PAS domain S-box protein [Magnetococcus sp. DMHC-6]
MIEDSESDFFLLVHALRRGGIDPVAQRVETADGVLAAFSHPAGLEAIIADCNMPQLDMDTALEIWRDHTDENIPFILFSGAIQEEEAVRLMKMGAHDFIRKDNLARLLPALERELREAKKRREHKIAIAALKESEKKYRMLMESANDAILVVDIETGRIQDANEMAGFLLDRPIYQVIDMYWNELFSPSQREQCELFFQKTVQNGKGTAEEIYIRHSSRKQVAVEVRAAVVEIGGKKLLQGIFRDISTRKMAEEALREGERRLAKAQEMGKMGSWSWDLISQQENWSDQTFRIFNIQPDPQKNLHQVFLRAIHPEDMAAVQHNLSLALANPMATYDMEYRLLLADGSVHYVHSKGEVIRDAHGQAIHMEGIVQDITQYKQIETALWESENRYRALFDTMTSGVAVFRPEKNGQDFIFQELNKAAEEIIQLSREHILDRRLTEIWPPSLHFGLLTTFQTVYTTGKPIHHPVTQHKDKQFFSWVEHFVYRLFSGEVVTVFDDITLRRKAEEDLRASEAKLRSLLDHSPDIILMFNQKREVLFQNRSIRHFPLDNLAPVYQSRFEELLEKIFTTGEVSSFTFPSGDASWWEIRLAPIYHVKCIHSVMAILTDITQQRVYQAQTLRNARLASLGVLSASVAHEVNNPNNAILFNAGLLYEAWQDAVPFFKRAQREEGEFLLAGIPITEALETLPKLLMGIMRSSDRIKNIVQDLKHLSRQDKGELNQKVPMFEVIQGAISILQNQIRKNTDHFYLDTPLSSPFVQGNSQQLEQVFINVILNALQALKSRDKKIWVTITIDNNQYVMVKVQDEGIGIDQQDLKKLTDPFFTTKLEAEGTGLGLSISHTIITNHQGVLEFESQKGVGTTVIIKLPLYETNEEATS